MGRTKRPASSENLAQFVTRSKISREDFQDQLKELILKQPPNSSSCIECDEDKDETQFKQLKFLTDLKIDISSGSHSPNLVARELLVALRSCQKPFILSSIRNAILESFSQLVKTDQIATVYQHITDLLKWLCEDNSSLTGSLRVDSSDSTATTSADNSNWIDTREGTSEHYCELACMEVCNKTFVLIRKGQVEDKKLFGSFIRTCFDSLAHLQTKYFCKVGRVLCYIQSLICMRKLFKLALQTSSDNIQIDAGRIIEIMLDRLSGSQMAHWESLKLLLLAVSSYKQAQTTPNTEKFNSIVDLLERFIKTQLLVDKRCSPHWQKCLVHKINRRLSNDLQCDNKPTHNNKLLSTSILIVLHIVNIQLKSDDHSRIIPSLTSLYSIQELICESGQLPDVETISAWIIDVFMEQDSTLCSMLNLTLEAYTDINQMLRLHDEQPIRSNELSNWPVERIPLSDWLNADSIFYRLLKNISYDESIMIDWLINPETEFLKYLTRFVKHYNQEHEAARSSLENTSNSPSIATHPQLNCLSDGLEHVMNYSLSSEENSDTSSISELSPMENNKLDANSCLARLYEKLKKMEKSKSFPYNITHLLAVLSACSLVTAC